MATEMDFLFDEGVDDDNVALLLELLILAPSEMDWDALERAQVTLAARTQELEREVQEREAELGKLRERLQDCRAGVRHSAYVLSLKEGAETGAAPTPPAIGETTRIPLPDTRAGIKKVMRTKPAGPWRPVAVYNALLSLGYEVNQETIRVAMKRMSESEEPELVALGPRAGYRLPPRTRSKTA
jgi:hypothetical protein